VVTDIYALGVLLYFLTTGRFPYHGKTAAELRDQVQTNRRTALLDARPALPAPLARIIERACHPDPSRRPHTVGLLGLELSEFLEAPAATAPSRRRWLVAPAAAVALAGASFLFFGRPPGQLARQEAERYVEAQKLIARYDQPGNLDRATGLLTQVMQSDPAFALAPALRAEAYALQYTATREPKALEAALADANRALSLNRELSPVHVTLGILHMTTGKRDLAAQELQRALQLDQSSSAAHRVMAALLGQQGREQEARASFQRATDLDPDDWQNYYAEANFVQKRGDNDSAIRLFERALARAPGNPLVLNNLGYTYLRKDDFPRAIQALERAVAIAPRYLAYTNLCGALLLESRYEQAVQSCRKAVELEPNQYSAWGDLAGAYQWSPGGKAQAAEHYRKAIALAEQARAVNPKDPRLLVLLGSYLATTGERQASLSYIRQAAALAPKDIEILFLAGEALELAGKRDEAIAKISEALRLGFSPLVLERSPELAGLRSDPRFSNRKLITQR
jgi:tetratricopeptide (TPR) repeat protein